MARFFIANGHRARPLNSVVRPHQMLPQEHQLRNLERAARYRALRNWTLGLGFVAFCFGVMATGLVGGIGNPKSASSIFSTFTLAGHLQWAAIPLISASFALVVVSAIFDGLSRRKHGEV